ncbi:hypothetical protein [Comamonas sp. BIGb0124]|uniref:hypothetical protein n=1 Tax=Comamonas sp. BIGb0124 TaxID=2485130 RepID=UPI001F36AB96|nr:hypothetical protein [Comamonas sp. BIGb0124]
MELSRRSRWVVWKGPKVPYCATAINSAASVTDPSTWASFPQAQAAYEEGGYSGVGFVLNGDGLVGIDLDGCVHGGRPEPAALALLERIGCGYVEVSPSGTGLRSFGYAGAPTRCKGRVDGISVELYATARYLTVTGRVLQSGPLSALPGFQSVANVLGGPTEENRGEQRITEDDLSHLLSSSVGAVIQHTLPATEGQRNKSLFALARHLKGLSPAAKRDDLRQIVADWHRLALPVIGTEEFSTSWADFMRGWDKVRMPFGSTIEQILDGVAADPLPPGVAALGYGEKANLLVKICRRLADHHAPEPFFIGARQAGELIDMHFTDASKVLYALVTDDVLELVKRGAGKVASRYRFVWDEC